MQPSVRHYLKFAAINSEQEKQCTYIVALLLVGITIVAVEKQ